LLLSLICHSGLDLACLVLDTGESSVSSLKDQKIALLEQRVSTQEKENHLLRQQNYEANTFTMISNSMGVKAMRLIFRGCANVTNLNYASSLS